MRYAISKLPAAAPAARAKPTTGARARRRAAGGTPDTRAIRFGDVLFHMTDAPEFAPRAGAARGGGGGAAARLKALPHTTPRQRLHMVVQKGRLFQQEHPDVPVLLDKGRYLVVDLDAKLARRWGAGHLPCYSIRPLPKGDVAFDVRAPLAAADARRRRRAAEPFVQALVDRITRQAFEEDLKRLVALPTRFSTSSHYATAATAARDILNDLGFDARLQKISVDGASSSNVIADKPGSGAGPRDVIVVGAHLDSVNTAGGPSAPAPGADDDGSGSAGVLSVARAVAGHAAAHDLRLILFGGEEQGLFGSRQYVASLSSAQRKRIRAVVHMDMVGTRNTTKPTVLLEGAALSQPVIDGLSEAAAAYTRLAVQTSLNPFNSDHVSFLDAKVPAVLTIEGTDDANHNVHTANDTMANIDFDLALDILRMNVGFVAQALGEAP